MITAKISEDNLDFIKQLLEHSTESIYIINAKSLKILYANSKACKSIKYSRNDLIKK